MRFAVLAYILQALGIAAAISQHLRPKGILVSQEAIGGTLGSLHPDGRIPWFIVGLFGFLGLFRSLLEFGRGGSRRAAWLGTVCGVFLIVLTFKWPALLEAFSRS